jgi:asparagine synthetase B (glutamine-hydrolysing)
MCGLFAGVGKLSSNWIVCLGSMNEDRGTDSVGIAYVSNNEVRIAKVAERPCIGLNTTLRKEVTEAAVSGMFIGHTRAATQGEITSKNAHPFFDDGIAFAHNGIIINDEDFGKYDVDSQSLIHGIKARDFSKYEGCIALVWIEEGKLKAYRCGNPLYRGRHNGGTYLASEAEQLKAIGCTHVRQLSEGMIYTFHDATRLTNERVPRNKSYTYTAGYASTGLGSSLADYDYTSYGGYKKPEYKLDAPEMPRSHGNLVDEDFSTWKDERDAQRQKDYCDMCGGLGELSEGYCLECLMWLKEAETKDVPPAALEVR